MIRHQLAGAAQGATPADSPTAALDVAAGMAAAGKATDAIHAALAELELRLVPILAPYDVPSRDTVPVAAARCPLGNQLAALVAALDVAAQRIEAIGAAAQV